MTKRLRPVKKYGNSYVITLSLPDMRDLKLKKGDVVDIDNLKKENEK